MQALKHQLFSTLLYHNLFNINRMITTNAAFNENCSATYRNGILQSELTKIQLSIIYTHTHGSFLQAYLHIYIISLILPNLNNNVCNRCIAYSVCAV